MDQIQKEPSDSSGVRKQTSMGTLIIWNITKAMEANPNIDLKSAITAAQEQLQQDAGSALTSGNQEEQYLSCALLAWQQLGQSDTEHLYQFVETKRKEFSERKRSAEKMSRVRKPEVCPGSFISYDSAMSKGIGSSSYDSSYPMGPVVELPRIVDTKIVMRVDSTPVRPTNRKPPDKELKNKIDAACCMDSACIEKLNELDKATADLRERAERLARREAERVELLERAEAAWKELELGYQRRLALAEEKEDDMAKHIKKMIEERNEYKNACTTLAVQLQGKGDAAEKERAKLTQLEKEVCEYASQRLRVSQEAAKLDAQLAEQQCKGAQVDRDLQFKEEQTRRKLQTMESELEGTRVLTCEAERALHAELYALRAQVEEVSRQLLKEDAEIEQIRAQLDTLRQEKSGLVEDLNGCNAMCDLKLHDKMEELKKKREMLGELKEQVMECQCKLPADASVQVKRTPSLAALCKCTPEDKFLNSCSCTSLRTTLITNLLEDLFGGLQSELGGCTADMPCQLLKCFEDKHNWDKSSVIKTNLRKYFSRLLIGELDIAIATSIEKYHAKWVGASCADATRLIPDRGGPENEGWEERVIERRAQKLASKLAEQLFEERADQLTTRAKEIVSTGPPPCECSPQPSKAAPAMYPCLVKQPVACSDASSPTWRSDASSSPTYWRRTHRDVVQLRVQLEDLKKDSIKKEDLKVMEENIVKLVQRATVTENVITESAKEKEKQKNEVHRKENSIPKSANTEQAFKHNANNKLSSIKKKQFDSTPKKNNKNIVLGLQMEKPIQSYKNTGQSYAVNLCLCGPHKDKKCKKSDPANFPQAVDSKKQLKAEATNVKVPQVLSKNQNKNMDSQLPVLDRVIEKRYKNSTHPPCPSNRICFHKPPSNTSIDKLLETLVKWKCDLTNFYSTPDNDKIRDSTSPNTEIGDEYKDIIPDLKIRKEPEKVMFKDVSTKFPPIESYAPFKSSVVVANISKSTEYPSEMPANTESVYMGAINLDKSNDNMCKCVSEVRNELEQSNEPKPTILKCMNSKACLCRKSECKNILDTNVLRRSLGTDNKTENIQKGENSVQTESKIEDDRKHIVKTSTLFPSNCEYCINFLGVTLTNASSSKVLVEKDNDPKLECTTDKSNKKRNNHPEVWYNNVDMCSRSKPPTQLPSCGFGVKSCEKEDILTNAGTKQHGDFCKNEDKSLNTPNFMNITNKKSCVCCNANKLDGSKDLEVNTFQLLEEYLREKINDFKLTNCKSDCIPPEEEEKMFNVILEKVKKIITDTTTIVACKCDSQGVAKGSWERTYMLLQEYLKIKIKRVQCLCFSTNDNKDAVLPNVMEKVSNLIDNDFQRLKEICKCQKVSEGIATSMNTDHPVKDHCHIQDYQTNTSNEFQCPEKMNKEKSNRSLIVTQNISSQISPNIETETTSCDIIKMTNQLTDTEHTDECYRIPELSYDHCLCTNSTKSTDPYVKMLETNNVDNNQCINVNHEVKEVSFAANMEIFHDLDPLAPHNSNTDLEKMPGNRKSAPYIGFTLDCPCANSALGTCTCTKIMSSVNNSSENTINTIWNTLTRKKLHHHDISYIMDSVPNKSSTEVNDLKKTRNTIGPLVPNKITCGTVSSMQDCEELVLKDSITKLNRRFFSTMTSSEEVRYAQDFTENADSCTDASNTCDDTLLYQMRIPIKRGLDDAVGKSEDLARYLSSSCDCNMVPMCHVKMLVENIENKLIHSKCTCDSLSSKICPVHSKKP